MSRRLLLAGAVATLFAAGPALTPVAVEAQAPAPEQAGQPTFRTTVDLVSTAVIVRDNRGQFVPDLQPSDFEVLEDGVKQDVVSYHLIHGGRTHSQEAVRAAVVPQEGIFLPAARPTSDASGRIFVLFIDDLHLDFRSTPRTRDIMKRMLKDLIHEGDMFGIVTTGTSSIEQQLTYDRQILEHAVERITGGALRLSEIRNASWGAEGPVEVRHRAHVAFETAYDLVTNLAKVQNRRKAVIYISSGYDFNPLERTRFEDQVERLKTTAEQLTFDPYQITRESQESLNEADLYGELAYLTRAANRANATFYTIDPRGLIAGQDIDDEVNTQDYNDYVRETQTSLRVIAEETGGFAIVNQNDFTRGLRRIDAETSDYYMLGYYSSNPDPLKRSRRIEIRVAGRPELDVQYRTEYTLRATTPPPSRR